MTDELLETAKAIAKLDVWRKIARYNWAVVSQLSADPFICVVNPVKEGPISGRLLFFRGFGAFRDFQLFRQIPDYGVALTPMDIAHDELIALSDGGAELVSYEPGYVPHSFDGETREMYGPVLRECFGLMMRFEENPELPARYAEENALFTRKEGLDGRWSDGPLKAPDMNGFVWTESVSLDRKKCEKAAALPFDEKVVWEVDLIQMLNVRTREAKPRFVYLLAAVEKGNGEKRLWAKTSAGADGLKALWENAAARLLDAVLDFGRIPGEIHLRSARLTRFLRPLGMQIPFKLVQHGELPALQDALAQNP